MFIHYQGMAIQMIVVHCCLQQGSIQLCSMLESDACSWDKCGSSISHSSHYCCHHRHNWCMAIQRTIVCNMDPSNCAAWQGVGSACGCVVYSTWGHRTWSSTYIYNMKSLSTHIHYLDSTSISQSYPTFLLIQLSQCQRLESQSKGDILEVATTQTWQGQWITHVPVKDSQPSPVALWTSSPSKKRTWSLEVMEFNDDIELSVHVPKRSRSDGKVCGHIHKM